MSAVAISAALETRLNALTPPLVTAWENVDFVAPSCAYQSISLKLAKPENPTFGDGFYRQRGYLQVALCYPLNTGKGDALSRGELLRGWFRRGLSLTANGVTTIIEETPQVGDGVVEDNLYVVRVFIRFYANIGS